jgi:MFS family permease
LLVTARFVAGMGGGEMGTVSRVLVADILPPADRGFHQGLTFAVFGAGMGLGGPIAVALTQAFGWRAAFYGEPFPGVTAHTRSPAAPRGACHHGYPWPCDWKEGASDY